MGSRDWGCGDLRGDEHSSWELAPGLLSSPGERYVRGGEGGREE